jgi:anti-sigma factor RsiW
MNKLSPAKEEALLRYLDGELNATEKTNLEAEIQRSLLLKTRLEELQSVHAYLTRKATLETPSRNFTMKVMEELDKQPVRLSFSPRKGIFLLTGIIVASVLLLMLLTNGAFDQTTTSLIVESPIKNKWITDPSFSIPFNVKILVNGIIFLNLALALILLDRTILRPMFQNRTFVGS